MTLEQQHAVEIFNAGIKAVQPSTILQSEIIVTTNELVICGHHFLLNSVPGIYVIGAGKASASMAVELEKIVGPWLKNGIVTTKYNHSLPSKKIKILEAAHPVPDFNSVNAVEETLTFLEQIAADDLVICLLSGGASALWCDLLPGITLDEMQITFDWLVKCGASIEEINIVRKHLSNIKGGQLIRHCNGAFIISVIISDVPGDKLDIIGSGPTVGDDSTFAQAYAVLSKYDLISILPESIVLWIENGLKGILPETPKKSDPLFRRTLNKVLGNNRGALQAAAEKAKQLGYPIFLNEDLITGSVETAAKAMAEWIINHKDKQPVCFLQGGETTIKVSGNGKGGRSQHFVLAVLKELQEKYIPYNAGNFTVLSGGTDGTDGPTDAAGAVANRATLTKAFQKGLSLETYLENYNSYPFFQQTQDLLMTGPTQTNVMDIIITIIN